MSLQLECEMVKEQ